MYPDKRKRYKELLSFQIKFAQADRQKDRQMDNGEKNSVTCGYRMFGICQFWL